MSMDRHYYSDDKIRQMNNLIRKTEEDIRNRIYEIDLMEVEKMAKCAGCRCLYIEPRSKIKDSMIESVYQMPLCAKGYHKCCGRKVIQVIHEEKYETV